MDKENRKKERELRRYHVKHRMEYYPLPLKWFKFFRYVSMILNIVSGVFAVINLITVFVALANPDNMAAVQQAYPGADGLLITSVIIEALITVYIIALCALVFIKMGELAPSAYNLIIVFLISFPIIKGIEEFLAAKLNEVTNPDFPHNVIGSVILVVVFSCIVSLLNYLYFRKRKSLFTDNLEAEDYTVDDGSVQLVHYDECPYCHTKTDGNSSFCENCGRNFTNSDDNRKE